MIHTSSQILPKNIAAVYCKTTRLAKIKTIDLVIFLRQLMETMHMKLHSCLVHLLTYKLILTTQHYGPSSLTAGWAGRLTAGWAGKLTAGEEELANTRQLAT
jgi:hypothetical protein